MLDEKSAEDVRPRLKSWIVRYESEKIPAAGKSLTERLAAVRQIGLRYGGARPGDAEFTQIIDTVTKGGLCCAAAPPYLSTVLYEVYRERKHAAAPSLEVVAA